VLLLYTSGTTGEMKAVVHSQNTLYAAARTVAESQLLTGDDVISVPNFLTHMAGSSFAVSMPVLLGATTVMQDNNTDMELFLDLVERHRITVVVPAGTPPTVGELREYLQGEGMAAVLCPDRVQFVWELPRNSLGKVLREPLRRRLEIAAASPK
jgi:acyl-coenzyme A synthetase/AMP-(fatty) acid ligase